MAKKAREARRMALKIMMFVRNCAFTSDTSLLLYYSSREFNNRCEFFCKGHINVLLESRSHDHIMRIVIIKITSFLACTIGY